MASVLARGGLHGRWRVLRVVGPGGRWLPARSAPRAGPGRTRPASQGSDRAFGKGSAWRGASLPPGPRSLGTEVACFSEQTGSADRVGLLLRIHCHSVLFLSLSLSLFHRRAPSPLSLTPPLVQYSALLTARHLLASLFPLSAPASSLSYQPPASDAAMPSLPANASLVIHAAGLITIFSIYGLCVRLSS